MSPRKTIDEAAARAAFEQALATHDQDFGKFFLAKLFGLDIQCSENECRIRLHPDDFMFNPQGWLHGGITSFVMDIAMGHLLQRTSGAGTTLEMKVQLVKPARGPLTCTGRFIRHGRSISFLRAEMVDAQNDLVAYATSTWKSLKPSSNSA